MTYSTIMFAEEAGVATITLNRPEKLNSFTAAMHAELKHAVKRAVRRAVRRAPTRRPRACGLATASPSPPSAPS